MARFMAVAKYSEGANWSEMGQHLPAEQARVAELFSEGVLERLDLAQDRSTVFLTFKAEHEAQARAALASLPLSVYWTVEMVPLQDLAVAAPNP